MLVRVASAVVAVAAALGAAQPMAQPRPVLVFAAASLKTALDDAAPPIRAALGVELRASYAATSALARQIEAGAPADIFISADIEWMDYVAERALIQPASRADLLGNQLVLIAPATPAGAPLRIAPGFNLAGALGPRGRLAVADPAAVPAGKYARAALTALGVWPSVSTRLAPAENVRAALVLVARGEAPLGIVYRTDALADPAVRIVDTFPATSHPPIVYPAALTKGASADAARVLAWLRGDARRAIFTRHGFGVLPGGARP